MTTLYQLRTYIIVLVMLLLSNTAYSASDEDNPILTTDKIFNLDYGNALYYLYQKKYFSALTQLQIAKTVAPITSQGFVPDIIYSGLALRYGINSLASKQLLFLGKSNLSKAEHDQIWFYQAKLNLLNTQDSLAEIALNQIGENLPETFIQEKNSLLIETYVRLNKLAEAQKAVDNIDSDNEFYLYPKYNLGVAYIRSNLTESGLKILEEIGELDSDRNDLLALKDKANLALGFSYLRENKPKDASKFLTRIRLKGPFSNKALLGLGWSYVLADRHKKALTPWIELKSRQTTSPAVQEVLISIPNSLEVLDKPKAAAGQYEDAINNYKQEIKKVKKTLRLIKSGEFIKSLKPSEINEDSDFPWLLTTIPETGTAAYLGEFFGTRQFQLGFENYRTLLYLSFIVDKWLDTLPSYNIVLDIRNDIYQQRQEQVDLSTQITKYNVLNEQYNTLRNKLDSIEKSEQLLALADSFETQLLQRLIANKKSLSDIGDSDESLLLQKRNDRLLGILRFDIERDYIPRLWGAKNSLNEIKKSLTTVANKKDKVKNSMSNAPTNFGEYTSRFSSAKTRLTKINTRLQNTLTFQKNQLNDLATNELLQRQILLQGYIDQANYSLARLFDKLAEDEK